MCVLEKVVIVVMVFFSCLTESCAFRMFSGCCVNVDRNNCTGSDAESNSASCYCDLDCFIMGDCCLDIFSSFCYPGK